MIFRRKYAPIAIAAALVAALLGSWQFYERLKTRVRVPSMVLADVEDALAQLDAQGLLYEVERRYDDDVVSGAVHAIAQADLLIVAGTSLTVYPAAGLIRYFRGKHIVLINRDATPMDSECDLVIHDKVGEVLSSLA